jgi:hypothetical protein
MIDDYSISKLEPFFIMDITYKTHWSIMKIRKILLMRKTRIPIVKEKKTYGKSSDKQTDLPKTEAEEQWRNFYLYDKPDMRLVLLTIILSPGPLQLITNHPSYILPPHT